MSLWRGQLEESFHLDPVLVRTWLGVVQLKSVWTKREIYPGSWNSGNDLKIQPHEIKAKLLVPLIFLVFASLCVFTSSSLFARGPIKYGLKAEFVRIWLPARYPVDWVSALSIGRDVKCWNGTNEGDGFERDINTVNRICPRGRRIGVTFFYFDQPADLAMLLIKWQK